MAAVDYFLRIEGGITGESTDQKHKGEIEIQSFSWGETRTGTGAVGGGAGTGKVQVQDFHFTAQSSKASPQLFLACASGKHFQKAVLTGRKAGQTQQEFLTFTLTEVVVSSYQISDSVDDGTQEHKHLPGPVDDFKLAFGKIEFQLNGTTAVWDVVANQST